MTGASQDREGTMAANGDRLQLLVLVSGSGDCLQAPAAVFAAGSGGSEWASPAGSLHETLLQSLLCMYFVLGVTAQ